MGWLAGEPSGEVVALEQLGDGQLAGVAQHLRERHRAEPLGVVHHLGPVAVEDAHQLVEVALGVGDDLLGRLRHARGRAPGRVADLAGEPADDEDGDVAEVLELAQFAQDDGVPERQLRARRVDAELHAQRPVFLVRRDQTLGEPVGRQDLGRAGRGDLVGLA